MKSINLLRAGAATVLAILLSACASQPAWQPAQTTLHSDAQRQCLQQLLRQDAVIAEQGLRDGGVAEVAGFPHLRANRMLASLWSQTTTDAAWQAWIQQLNALDLSARHYEILSLDERGRLAAGLPTDETLATAKAEDCSRLLAQAHAEQPALRTVLGERVAIADDYRSALRVLGLYPLTRWAVLPGVKRLHRRLAADFEVEQAAFEDDGPLRAYSADSLAAHSVSGGWQRDALGMPLLSERELQALYSAHAPVWMIETRGDYDLPGAPFWRGEKPDVDTGRASEYRFLSHTHFKGELLPQLNYQIWFRERPSQGPFDLLSGRLDSVIWRVTLAADGSVLAAESVHSCGCYYMALPSAGLAERDPPPPGEPIFIPAQLPALAEGERWLLRLDSGSHYLSGVAAGRREKLERLQAKPAQGLQAIATDEGYRSLYQSSGLVAGTERAERWLLWPMGISEPGAMRQPGRQPIAFVGRRHFDQPDLLELIFQRQQGE